MTILCTLLEIIILVGCLYGIVVWLRFTPKVWKGYGFFDRLTLLNHFINGLRDCDH